MVINYKNSRLQEITLLIKVLTKYWFTNRWSINIQYLSPSVELQNLSVNPIVVHQCSIQDLKSQHRYPSQSSQPLWVLCYTSQFMRCNLNMILLYSFFYQYYFFIMWDRYVLPITGALLPITGDLWTGYELGHRCNTYKI